MKLFIKLLAIPFWILIVSTNAYAGDFDWIKGFNIHAESNPSGFRARLEARFQIGDVAINTVLTNCKSPSDAFIILRIGEISGLPIDHILREYKSANGKGWGAMARNLGIKPGSREFHALKQGHDLNSQNHNSNNNQVQVRGQGKNGNKGKGKGRK